MGDQSCARPLSTQESPAQRNKYKHPCCNWDSNPRCQRPSDQSLCLRPHGHLDQHTAERNVLYLVQLLLALLGDPGDLFLSQFEINTLMHVLTTGCPEKEMMSQICRLCICIRTLRFLQTQFNEANMFHCNTMLFLR
jgi:hypothetical protein